MEAAITDIKEHMSNGSGIETKAFHCTSYLQSRAVEMASLDRAAHAACDGVGGDSLHKSCAFLKFWLYEVQPSFSLLDLESGKSAWE